MWLSVLGDDHGPVVVPKESEPKHTISPESQLIDFVDLCFVTEFLQNLVTYTDHYADTWIQNNQHLRSHPASRDHGWIKQGKTNLLEIKAFLGIVINMGLIKKKANLKLYWVISHPCASTPWFVIHFNRDRS